MEKTAEIFVNLPVKSVAKAYTYRVPKAFRKITAGWRVLVPFGGRKLEGFVVSVGEMESADGLKDIEALVDEEAWFSDKLLLVAQRMADYYLCSQGEAMRLFMPGKSGLKIVGYYYVKYDAKIMETLEEETRALYIFLLENQPATRARLERRFGKNGTARALRVLLARGVAWRETAADKRDKIKYEKLFSAGETLREALANNTLKRRPAQKKAADLLAARATYTLAELKQNGVSAATVKELEKNGLIKLDYRRVYRDTYVDYKEAKSPPPLAPAQQAAFQAIAKSMHKRRFQTFLLYGITGSGKTQVYIESVAAVRRSGRQAIVLVPEIALTSQIVRRFKAYFHEDVVVLHSKLSAGERNDAVAKFKSGLANIVIGARSALFVPAGNLGIIILDEEHDGSYKQDESPRYHTRDVAQIMAEVYDAILVLGSATPSMESYAKALKGEYTLLELKERFDGAVLPEVQLVDMRQELRQGRRNVISEALRRLIAQTTEKGEQLILLLNRRGFSTFVMCRACGHVMTCPDCTLPLAYHRDGRLLCHFCDTSYAPPDVCPSCGSRYIKYFGTGTERLESELQEEFPSLRLARMDRDTMGKKTDHVRLLDDFAAGRYDILLGTQMVAKGHDVKNVTGVGIISADAGLNLPDFRAAERCFALLTQAAGRAGRGGTPGRVVIQTYNPAHYAVMTASHHDYESFFRQEIALRKNLFYPPYCHLIKLFVQDAASERAAQKAESIAAKLRETGGEGFFVIGPFEPSMPQLRGIWRRGILLKIKDEKAVRRSIRKLGLQLDSAVSIDVNPLNVT